MSKIRHILSVIHYKTRGSVCFQLTHFPCDDWENIYTLSYYHHRIGSMNYYPLFRVRSWNNGVRCVSFCILTTTSNEKLRPHFELTNYTRTSSSRASYVCLSWVIWRKVTAIYRERTLMPRHWKVSVTMVWVVLKAEYIMALRSYSVLNILLPSIIIIIQDRSWASTTGKCL